MGKMSEVEISVSAIVDRLIEVANIEVTPEQIAEITQAVQENYTGWFFEGSLPLQQDVFVLTANGQEGLVTNFGPTSVTRAIVQTFLDAAGIISDVNGAPFLLMELEVFKRLPVEKVE